MVKDDSSGDAYNFILNIFNVIINVWVKSHFLGLFWETQWGVVKITDYYKVLIPLNLRIVPLQCRSKLSPCFSLPTKETETHGQLFMLTLQIQNLRNTPSY